MNIGKSIHFFRRGKRLNWYIGQRLYHDPDQHDNKKIVEYQDRWTKIPSREPIRLDDAGGHT